jgi:hypothetical protein
MRSAPISEAIWLATSYDLSTIVDEASGESEIDTQLENEDEHGDEVLDIEEHLAQNLAYLQGKLPQWRCSPYPCAHTPRLFS